MRGFWLAFGAMMLGISAWSLTRPGPCERLREALCAGEACAERPEWEALGEGACRQGLDALEVWEALPPALRGPTREALVEGILSGADAEGLLRRIGS